MRHNPTDGMPYMAVSDDTLDKRHLMIGRAQWEALRVLAFEQRRSISDLVREAIDKYLGVE